MEIRDFEHEAIRLSRKYNISVDEVKKIYNYQFKACMQVIKEDTINKPLDERRSIKLRGLGTIQFNKFATIKILNNLKKHDERKSKTEVSSEDGHRTSAD